MNEDDKSKEIITSCNYGLKRHYISENEKNKDLIFQIDYETLLKNCKEEEKYIDLNLEINYNLEEIVENKDNIKKCVYLHDEVDDEYLYSKKENDYYIKNNKYYYDNNFHSDIDNGISPFNYEREKENIDKKNKYLHYEKDYNSENNSSYTNDTYCSDFTENSSKYEKTKSMNFSQRITYDNNELIHNLNLYNKIVDYNLHNKKYEENSKNYSQMIKEQKENSNCYDSIFIKKKNNEKYSCYNEKQMKMYHHDFYDNIIHKKPNEPKYMFSKYNNQENSPLNLKLLKNRNSLNSVKMEEKILNKYEKILKVMKYLRKIKTKYPEIETIVSILSNHVKNVTFNCEKMFDSRSQLNDFLKKIYIYQIFLLKKVVFKDQNIMKNNNINKYHNNNTSRNKIRFISTDEKNLRDYSIILEDSSRNDHFMLNNLDRNISFNTHNKNINEDIKKHEGKKYEENDEIFNRKYEKNSKGKHEKGIHEILESKKGNFIDKGNEHIKGDLYNEYKIKKNIYNEFQVDKNVKNIDEKVIKDNTNNYKYKDIYNNYDLEEIEKKCSYDYHIKDKYYGNTKFIYGEEENIKNKKKKEKIKKKNENILDIDNVLNKVITQQKNEKFMKTSEKDALYKRELFEKIEKNNKKNILNRNSNECKLNDYEPEELHKYTNGNNLKYLAYKEREGELNLNALNLESNNSAFRNRFQSGKYKKKSIDEEEKKTHVLYYDVNKELTAISNRESVTHALKYTLLNKPKNFATLQNFLFKIDVELVDYKNFILLITKDIKEPHLEALYGLNDFSIFEKVYGKKVAPRFLVPSKVKAFYKYDKFYQTFKELTNVKDFSGITDAVQLI
ncbi:conserved Plasmodium protein, unknown function [Plasmodium gallinaceum]|uniref:CKK domain-containing protein n=1 Tax=Plasmodium gallinaceum TaxID=5849 RepID=A0A1J1GRK7_PLAGA|nr:conserved Plasmodium protein, unknown function [Plasmodium gallinaceum]CRG94931.1 conserved Plasmodium protein, unknown function [Plasmodium gallinaceum]